MASIKRQEEINHKDYLKRLNEIDDIHERMSFFASYSIGKDCYKLLSKGFSTSYNTCRKIVTLP